MGRLGGDLSYIVSDVQSAYRDFYRHHNNKSVYPGVSASGQRQDPGAES